MDLQTSVVQRLAFVKYLYRLGIQQSQAPEPLSSAGLLSFHDAIELFLQLSCEHLNIVTNKPEFKDYLGLLKSKLGAELSQAAAMKRLNGARVSLKHDGRYPTKYDLEAFRGNTTSFFEENTPLIFGIPFAAISMTDFVQPESARDNLKEAERLIDETKLQDAIDKTAIAFRQMLYDYESRKRDRYDRSPFYFGRDLTFYSSHFMNLNRGLSLIHGDGENHHHKYEKELGDFVDVVKESLEAIQEAIKILALGIDYRRYTKFRYLTPIIDQTLSGKYVVSHTRETQLSMEDVRFCIEFVVESAVKLPEFDYSMSISNV